MTKEDYIAYVLHPHAYPTIANSMRRHFHKYQNCDCKFWIPVSGSPDFRNDRIDCSSCECVVYEETGYTEKHLLKYDAFLMEYASFYLNLNVDKDVLELCNCCYQNIKQLLSFAAQ